MELKNTLSKRGQILTVYNEKLHYHRITERANLIYDIEIVIMVVPSIERGLTRKRHEDHF